MKSHKSKRGCKQHGFVGESGYHGLLYILPWILGFLIFTLYPMLASLIMGFFEINLKSDSIFVGLRNFHTLLHDTTVRQTFRNTFCYVAFLVPLKLLVSLAVALLLQRQRRGAGLLRTAFYMPSILGSSIAVAILWRYLFSTEGLMNQCLCAIGLAPISWFGEPAPAMSTLILLRIWQFGSTMILLLVARQNIPQMYYDAARVDGASPFRQFRSITLPLLRPTLFFNFILQLIEAFQEFNAPYLITGGAPLNSTYFVSMLIYDETFRRYHIGYAAAISWVFFFVLLFFTVLAFRFLGQQTDDTVRSGGNP